MSEQDDVKDAHDRVMKLLGQMPAKLVLERVVDGRTDFTHICDALRYSLSQPLLFKHDPRTRTKLGG